MNYKIWLNRLYSFEKWRYKGHNVIIRAWWLYLKNRFFHEIESIDLSRTGIYLDVGCGEGGYLTDLLKRKRGVGIGIDPLESSLVSFKTKIKRFELSNIELIRGIGENIPCGTTLYLFVL
jgi:ubiquinone/menaquinone biosynthesis C-methylase UbiE